MPDGSPATNTAGDARTRITPSRYTILVPLRGDRHLAYNTLSQSFAIWEPADMAMWRELEGAGTLPFTAA